MLDIRPSLSINANMQLVPLMPTLCSIFFAFPLTFAQELDARGVHQQA
jgi:hypothetical protein